MPALIKPTRLHYSSKPFTQTPRVYTQRTEQKPDGLWYSVGSAWKDWCESEQFNLQRLQCVCKLEIDESRILKVVDLLAFTEQYGVVNRTLELRSIDWAQVASAYAGIEIAPYQYKHRLSLLWYYPWDVASGCIWDLSVIKKVEPL